MAFENIIGNEKIKQLLTKSIAENNLVHSYLFVGKSGIGKKIFAKEFAKMILCLGENKLLCNNCKSCIQFLGQNHPDFMEIQPEDGKSIKIEQIRYLRRKNSRKANYLFKKSLYYK